MPENESRHSSEIIRLRAKGEEFFLVSCKEERGRERCDDHNYNRYYIFFSFRMFGSTIAITHKLFAHIQHSSVIVHLVANFLRINQNCKRNQCK